jgi:hypothetical protein
VQYEAKRKQEHNFWVGRHGPHSIRIDANRPGLYRWIITPRRSVVPSGVAADRDQVAQRHRRVAKVVDAQAGQVGVGNGGRQMLRRKLEMRSWCASSSAWGDPPVGPSVTVTGRWPATLAW